jgi:hypothetical protein
MLNIEETGRFYGYPDCCIEDFKKRLIDSFIMPTNIQIKVSNNTGFIPCQNCSEKVIKENLKINNLIVNRQCSKKFPGRR